MGAMLSFGKVVARLADSWPLPSKGVVKANEAEGSSSRRKTTKVCGVEELTISSLALPVRVQ